MDARQSRPILPLTSVRFFAAFYVVLLHSATWTNYLDTSTWIGRFLRTGYTAVGFFFVLSGYILAHVYLDTDRPFKRRSFWTARFARTYPLLFASLLLDTPNALLTRLSLHGMGAGIAKTLVSLISECALLQAWGSHFRGINAPSWSLSVEAFFYLIFPFVSFWIWRRKGPRAIALFFLFWAAAIAAPLVVTLRYPALFVEVDTSNLQWDVELMPVFRMWEFLAGIALCSFQKSVSENVTPERLNRYAYLALGSAVALFIAAIEGANHIPLLVMSNGFLLPVYGLLILGLTNVRGWLSDLLSKRWLVILGEASYAVYLLHQPLWTYFSRLRTIDTLPLWLAYLALVIAASIASFFWLERPARKFILSRASVRPPVVLNQEQVAPS